jgi:hypothetical protein
MQSVASLGGDEIVDEVGGCDEADAVAAQAGELADGVRKVGFADAKLREVP